MHLQLLIVLLSLTLIFSAKTNVTGKIDSEILDNYSNFFNFGLRKAVADKTKNENAILKSKIDVLGDVFKANIQMLKQRQVLDLVFLIDASSSVGEGNFQSELSFVRKFLSDVTVEYNQSRIAIVTFSSPGSILAHIDELSDASEENNKCLLLNKQFQNISYSGGSTYTANAFVMAEKIFNSSREEATKIVFLITDGFSNGEDPIPIANALKEQNVIIFTIGVRTGNYKELFELASSPGEYHSFLLDSFPEFEALARRALHVDLKSGDYLPLGSGDACADLCETADVSGDCCDENAHCACGTTTGQYSCVCQLGYYGSGLKNSCFPCPSGTYAEGPNSCLPCPDSQHMTIPPAVNAKDCICKPGYRSTKENQCEAIKCHDVEEPENGYFVKNTSCSNVLNSACGVRCKVGYALTGSSIRLCQNDSSWSGTPPSCQVKTCSSLPIPDKGAMTCHHPDLDIVYENDDTPLPVDTICSFSCSEGRMLIGSKHRNCLPLAQWDGLKSSCRQVKCNKLNKIPFATIEPASCLVGKQVFGQVCNVTCMDGFKHKGSPQRTCTGKASDWHSNINVICKDVTKPNLTCPDDVEVPNKNGKTFGFANWTEPVATDNSGLNVTMWLKPAITNITKFKFKLGTTNVTYAAMDAFNNKMKCTFTVTVVDKEVPTIEGCVDPPIFLATSEKGADNVTWDEPVMYDNSPQKTLMINKSHSFGFFPLGTTGVTYSIQDASNNTNICVLNITVEENKCVVFPELPHGNSSCSESDKNMQCVVTCEEGYAIPFSNEFATDLPDSTTMFDCDNSNPSWSPDGPHPECSVTEIPLEVNQKSEVIVEIENACEDGQKIHEMENEIKSTIESNLKEECLGITCKLDTSSDCIEESSDTDKDAEEEKTNKIKRDLRLEENLQQKVAKKHRRKKLRVKVNVNAKNKKHRKNPKIANLGQKIKDTQYFAGQNISVTVRVDEPILSCAAGSIAKKLQCVQCPQGTFHNISAKACQSCSIGYYNNRVGRTTCSSCPINHSTRKIHAKSVEFCLEECPPGTFARKKQIRNPKHSPNSIIERVTLKPFCTSCGLGTYQPKYGQLVCLPCPEEQTTDARGAASRKSCALQQFDNCNVTNVCQHGNCVQDSSEYLTCECHQYYVGTHCEHRILQCQSNPCLNHGTCNEDFVMGGYTCACAEGFRGDNCADVVDTCTLTCLNGGHCAHADHDEQICICAEGFLGPQCDTVLKYCTPDVCQNGARCNEMANGYKCACVNGYIGKRCTILPCDYRPCPPNAVCRNENVPNATLKNYRCTCLPGYKSPGCSERINFCDSSPCVNGGKCIALVDSYRCDCQNVFSGRNCEVQLDGNYVMHFPRSGISDYVLLDGFSRNLTEISVCFWVQTTDSINYGTVLSYATRRHDNAFTITDYTGLVLYVNGKHVVTDVYLNDGSWHHFCVTWSSQDGDYTVFVDGHNVRFGQSFADGEVIQAGGKLIIGQEQDALGGRFSQSESFIGRLAQMEIWSTLLSQEEIRNIMNSCDFYFSGNLYSWNRIRSNVRGDVIIEENAFCKPCSEPDLLVNGFIDVIENIVYYKCYDGYQLNAPDYLTGRKCLKSGIWEGQIVPECSKIFCSYPEQIRNGYYVGNGFYFNNTVEYICYDGFNLTGAEFRRCSEKGAWEPKAPSCIWSVQCPIKKPQHGDIKVFSDSGELEDNAEQYEPGIVVDLVCHNKTKTIGNTQSYCHENGTWDTSLGYCEPDLACSLDTIPKPPMHGFMVTDRQKVLEGRTDTITYDCRDGYKLRGDSKTICILDGYWSEMNSTCLAITCGKAPRFSQMTLSYGDVSADYHAGMMAVYRCAEGYRIFGNGYIRCLKNRRWSRMNGKCIKISCSKPNVVEGTEIVGNSYLYLEKVLINCEGRVESIVCTASGLWSLAHNRSPDDLQRLPCWNN